MVQQQQYANDKPVIKLFTSRNKNYVYDVYSNRIFELTKEQYQELHRLVDCGISDYTKMSVDSKSYSDILLMLQKGYFRSPWIEEIKHEESEYIPWITKRGISFLSLQVTNECNFKCRYCLYTRENKIDRTHENIKMSWDVAKRSVDFLWRNSKDSSKINIAFYGGEPLLNFNLIKKVVAYADEVFELKNITYNLTTNGSILTDYIIDFLAEKNFNIAISLDGPELVQNRHRKFYTNGNDTFHVVWKNVVRIKNRQPEWYESNVFFHPVLMHNEDPEEVFAFFSENGVSRGRVILNLASLDGIDFDNSDATFLSHADGIIQSQSNNMSRNAKTRFMREIYESRLIPVTWHHSGPCVPSSKKIHVDSRGFIYPCEKLIDSFSNTIGDIDHGIDDDKVNNILNIGKMTEDTCRSCFAMRFCNICVQKCYNPETRSIDAFQKTQQCELVKKRTLRYLLEFCENSQANISSK